MADLRYFQQKNVSSSSYASLSVYLLSLLDRHPCTVFVFLSPKISTYRVFKPASATWENLDNWQMWPSPTTSSTTMALLPWALFLLPYVCCIQLFFLYIRKHFRQAFSFLLFAWMVFSSVGLSTFNEFSSATTI